MSDIDNDDHSGAAVNGASRVKSVSLNFRGLAGNADEVGALLGVPASMSGNRGELVRPYVKTRLARSYALFSKEFPFEFPLNEMLPALVKSLGGEENILRIKGRVQPEFLEVNFDLPSSSAEASQDGFLSEEVIATASRLGVSIGFEFF
jgi:hypothetical protein